MHRHARERLALATGSFLLAGAAVAQTTTVPKPDGIWRGALGAAATITSGNSSNVSANVNADAVRQTATDKAGLYLQDIYGRGKVDGQSKLTAQIFRTGGRYDFDISTYNFAFGAIDVDKNKFADIRWRYLPQLGLGRHVVRTDRNTWDVFAGYAYNWTDTYEGGGRRESDLLFGEESTHKLTETTSAKQRFVIYPSLKNTGEYRTVFEASVTAKLLGEWNLVVNVSHRYDSAPPGDARKSDVVFFTGIQYGWGPR